MRKSFKRMAFVPIVVVLAVLVPVRFQDASVPTWNTRASNGIFVAATYAETQQGWGKYAPTPFNQSGPTCTASATANALRVLLVFKVHWSKDLKWSLDWRTVYDRVGAYPKDVAKYTSSPGYTVTGSHVGMRVTASSASVYAGQPEITSALAKGPVALAVNAASALGKTGDDPHEVLAVYASSQGLLVLNSWGVGWLGTGFAWIRWSDVSTYADYRYANYFYNVVGHRPV